MIGKYVTFNHKGETRQGEVLDKILWHGHNFPITGYLILSQSEIVTCPYYSIGAIVEGQEKKISVR